MNLVEKHLGEVSLKHRLKSFGSGYSPEDEAELERNFDIDVGYATDEIQKAIKEITGKLNLGSSEFKKIRAKVIKAAMKKVRI